MLSGASDFGPEAGQATRAYDETRQDAGNIYLCSLINFGAASHQPTRSDPSTSCSISVMIRELSIRTKERICGHA